MSGKPYPEGVAEFRALLARMAESGAESARLRTIIDTANRDLNKANESFYAAQRSLFDLMAKMDIASNGNAGYENRMTWFLVELQRQYEQSAGKLEAK